MSAADINKQQICYYKAIVAFVLSSLRDGTYINVLILPSFSQYGPHPLQHGSRPMPLIPDLWEQSQQQQQPPRIPYSSLKRPAPLLGENSVIQHAPLSLNSPNDDCPSPSKRKRSSVSEQVRGTT